MVERDLHVEAKLLKLTKNNLTKIEVNHFGNSNTKRSSSWDASNNVATNYKNIIFFEVFHFTYEEKYRRIKLEFV